jgi:hypothetical protein
MAVAASATVAVLLAVEAGGGGSLLGVWQVPRRHTWFDNNVNVPQMQQITVIAPSISLPHAAGLGIPEPGATGHAHVAISE